MNSEHYFITGGCGFVGSNLTARLLADGHRVTVFDNLSRAGVERNRAWLAAQPGTAENLRVVQGDVRDLAALRSALDAAEAPLKALFHTAGQVAVTTSITDPRTDFEINALGTFNVLEATRLSGHRPAMIMTSTNKVYGGMEEVGVVETATACHYADLPHGVPETQPLDFHSPYGCSKGTADQYWRDYARIYGLATMVFRMSCQYGPRQFGTEDQGWVAHFVIAAHRRRPITIYGNGKQVRDILFVDDLVAAFLAAAAAPAESIRGQVLNIGGGPANTLSLRDLIEYLGELTGQTMQCTWGPWRPGDQPVYISDTRRAEQVLGWCPTVPARQGVAQLLEWVKAHDSLFA